MADKKQFGAFWGGDKIYFVESVNVTPKKFFSLPIKPRAVSPIKENNSLSSDSMDLTYSIQESLRQHNIGSMTINLALPTKDIIFRSFVIPWMQSAEVRAAVDFEAGKYIPFALKDLAYAFHSIMFNDKGTRRLRIVFVAIRKDTLDGYSNVLDQAGIPVNVVEPAALSLIRFLSFKNLLPPNQTIAIIEKAEDVGRIVIVDQGIPHFIRDFQLKPIANDPEANEPRALMGRLINEIRISLDYFNRQNTLLKVNQALLLSNITSDDVQARLEEELTMPVTTLQASAVVGNDNIDDIGFLSSVGISLCENIPSPVSFNLSQKTEKKNIKLANIKAPDMSFYKMTFIVAAVCVAIIVGVGTLLKDFSKGGQQTLAQQKKDLGVKDGLTLDLLKQQIVNNNSKLEGFKNVRAVSDASLFLSTTPQLLPDGVWIKTMEIVYSANAQAKNKADEETQDSRSLLTSFSPIINITGYVYLEDKNEQFRLVNKLLKNFKENENFKFFFKTIDMEVIRADKINDYQVTFFKLKCQ